VSIGNDVSKIIVAVAALVASLGGFWVAIGGGSSDSSQVPAVIVIRGSTLPDDVGSDGMTDSEWDREWVLDESP
jgi:hypothetical protein